MFDGLALGTMGGTYGAAPLACATANATLDVIEDENLLQNSTDRGRQLVEVQHSIAAIDHFHKEHEFTRVSWYALLARACTSLIRAGQT